LHVVYKSDCHANGQSDSSANGQSDSSAYGNACDDRFTFSVSPKC
jgi:hypothetical protein